MKLAERVRKEQGWKSGKSAISEGNMSPTGAAVGGVGGQGSVVGALLVLDGRELLRALHFHVHVPGHESVKVQEELLDLDALLLHGLPRPGLPDHEVLLVEMDPCQPT